MHAPVPPGWMPASPCTQACLPAPARPSWTQALRLAAVAAVLLTALATVPFAGNRWLATCCRALLRATGVRLRVTPARAWDAWAGVLVVANHLSSIDVVALTAVAPVRLLAQCEVGGWPLIGGSLRAPPPFRLVTRSSGASPLTSSSRSTHCPRCRVGHLWVGLNRVRNPSGGPDASAPTLMSK